MPEDAEVCCIRLPWVMVNNSSSRCLFPLALLLFLWLSFLFFSFFFYHFAKNKDSFAQYFNTTLCTSYIYISAEHNLISTLMNALIYTLTITSPRAGLWRNGSEDPVRKMYHFDWVMLFFLPKFPECSVFLFLAPTHRQAHVIFWLNYHVSAFLFLFFYYSFLRSQNRPISCVHTQRNTHTVTPDLNVLELLLFN